MTARNGKALTRAREAYKAGYRAASIGSRRDTCYYKDTLMYMAWIRGYDQFRKRMKEIHK
jgi:ribosome modulation factor